MTAPLPPGSSGLPLIGETLPFISDMFGFMRTRFERHGRVFRSHILGSPTVFVTGADLTDVWLDESCVQRAGSFPANVRALFGGESLPLLDGEEHRTRKQLVMTAFKRDAFAEYLPKLEAAVRASLGRAIEAASDDFSWLAEMKRLAVDAILRTVFGIAPGPEMEAMLGDYAAITRGFTGLPIDLPGTDFRAGLKARDRIFERIRAAIAAHRNSPSAFEDGLARLLAAEVDGKRLSDEELVLELHHVVIAGLIVFAELACMVTALTEREDIRQRLVAEVDTVVGADAITLEALGRMPYLERVVLETKRACPNVPVSFGRARKDFEIGGYRVKQGWFVFMSVYANNIDERYFPSPESFDPDRFAPERAEHARHRHAYQPQGAGKDSGHRCAGKDFSTVFMQIFLARLIRDVTWTLPDQELGLRWDVVPPEPRGGLKANVKPRAA